MLKQPVVMAAILSAGLSLFVISITAQDISSPPENTEGVQSAEVSDGPGVEAGPKQENWFVRIMDQGGPVMYALLLCSVLVSRQWDSLNINAGYTYLHKDADYGENLVVASFYALNFARHRATLALRYLFGAGLELRLDNEYRVQRDNPLRTSDEDAWLASIALAWRPLQINGLAFTLTADNVTDSDFQFFPGTPAVGRQFSLSAAYSW